MKFTIDKKVALFESGILLVMGAIFVAYFIAGQSGFLDRRLQAAARSMLGSLAIQLEYPVLVGDGESIARLVKGVMAQESVVYCRIEDRKGVTLYEEGRRLRPLREFSSPIVTEKTAADEEMLILGKAKEATEKIGQISLGVSPESLTRELDRMKKAILAGLAAAIIVASVGTFLLLRRSIGAPVARLVRATQQIAGGDLDSRVAVTSKDEFGTLAESFNKMTTALSNAQQELIRKEKLSILGQLAGTVGHELRNPLGVMGNAVYFLKSVVSDSDATVREYLDIIKGEIDNSLRIISDLLDFSRTKTPQAKSVAVNELIGQILGKCAVTEGVVVAVDVPDTLPPVRIDPFQIGQVLQNLFTNAIQAMPNGGSLRISAGLSPAPGCPDKGRPENAEDLVEISVTDTGAGIPPENMERLFQPLYTTKPKGIGLGLTVCKTLTEANGGAIQVESEPGTGTTFSLFLPKAG